jgi:hypothetical protein
MSEHPRNGERVIITAKLLAEMFAHLPVEIYLMVLAPFSRPQAEAERLLDEVVEHFRGLPEEPGKSGAVEGFEALRNAY